MNKLTQLGLISGLLLLIFLLLWQGLLEIFQLLLTSGWHLLWLPLVWLPNVFPITQAWRLCFHKNLMPAYWNAIFAMWVGRAVNNLLPVATIGGEIVKARLVTIKGCSAIDASASVMVDKTVQVFALIIWGLIGIGYLLYFAIDHNFAIVALGGFGILAVSVVGFLWIQKIGLFSLMARFFGTLIKTEAWDDISQSAKEVDEIVLQLYRQKKRFLIAVAYKTLGNILQTSEVWLGCYLLGFPISLPEAIMLKSLTATLSDIAFIIPNAYGIQEGAFILVGALLGIEPEFALALSLAIRVRELVIDIPGLLIWQQIESKHLLRRQSMEA